MVGVVWAAALLLGYAGLRKLIRPDPTVRALEVARIPGAVVLASPTRVRLVGLVELAVGAWVLLAGGATSAALLGVSYLLLTLVALRMITTAPGADCGCFGSSAEPIGPSHLVVNIACLLVAAAAVFVPQPGVLAEGESQGMSTLLVLALAALLAFVCAALMTSFPALLAQRAKVAAT